MSANGERGVEAHILGLGVIQLARTHKADTRTKLLAVLVWLSNRTTYSCANSPWQYFGIHYGGPLVIYLHTFKFIARARALDIHFELQR